MSRLSHWFPASCSRLRIFISYAHEDRKLAEEIAQALTNDGHDVFIDTKQISVSGGYAQRIRRAIEAADRFVFLISPASMARGYPRSELRFAQKRWPSPQGAVWPILVDPSTDKSQLPAYIRSVQIHSVTGSVTAEVAAEIEKSRAVKPRCIFSAVAVLALLLGGASLLVGGLDHVTTATFTLLPPQQVDFRPAKKPGPDQGWAHSRLAVTLIPVQYSNESSTQVRILNEIVTVKIKDRSVQFRWHNEVDMKANCGADWLCTKGSVGADTLKPDATLRRETMFMPAPGETVTWQDFLDAVCQSKADRLDVTISGEVRTSGLLSSNSQMRTAVCHVDLKAVRERLKRLDCATGLKQVPVRISPMCLNS
jgi:TIR domain